MTLLGLLANVSTPTEIARRAKIHFPQLKQFLRFRNKGTPSRVTFSRILRKLSLDDLQAAFAEFLNGILDDSPITEVPMSAHAPLEIFVHCLKNVPDPRSKYGTSHPFTTALALVFLGLLANLSTLAEIQRWAEIHFPQLRKFLVFKNKKGKRRVPHAITLARMLRKLSLDDLQKAFAMFLNGILDDQPIAAAVDRKVAKQMKDLYFW